MIETQAGDISAFVPTNVISITDGQVFLETQNFNSGLRPAINPGTSVSRVGGDAQVPFMKKLAGGVKLALAQYRELAAFSQFASDLDEATRKQLEHGERVTELMKQKQYSPMSVAEMGVMLFTANEGFLEDVPVDKVLDFERALLDYMNSEQGEFMSTVNETGAYNDDIVDTMRGAIEAVQSDAVVLSLHLTDETPELKTMADWQGNQEQDQVAWKTRRRSPDAMQNGGRRSKMRRTQERMREGKPYSEKHSRSVIGHLANSNPEYQAISTWKPKGRIKRVGYLVDIHRQGISAAG